MLIPSSTLHICSPERRIHCTFTYVLSRPTTLTVFNVFRSFGEASQRCDVVVCHVRRFLTGDYEPVQAKYRRFVAWSVFSVRLTAPNIDSVPEGTDVYIERDVRACINCWDDNIADETRE